MNLSSALLKPIDTPETEVDMALSILDRVAGSAGSVTIAQICDDLGLPRERGSRIIYMLARRKMLICLDDRVALGRRPARWGIAALQVEHLTAVAEPVMHDLNRETGFNAALFVFEPPHVVCIKHVGLIEYENGPRLGTPFNAYRVASGRAILACLPERFLTDYISAYHLDMSAAKVEADIVLPVARAREVGYAISESHLQCDVVSAACPVLSGQAEPIAAISLWRASYSCTHDMIREALPTLREAAAELSRLLGARKYL
jgi:IclR family acetate operon transcriptional repressor